jgi:hypothetical protein
LWRRELAMGEHESPPLGNPNAEEVAAVMPEKPDVPEASGHPDAGIPVPLLPLAETGVVGELVWDPVKGTHRKRAPWERAALERKERSGAETKELLWRDPARARYDDKRVRLMMTATGALVTGVYNHWGKWLVAGYGVVDPVAYAEISRPRPEDMPWRS